MLKIWQARQHHIACTVLSNQRSEQGSMLSHHSREQCVCVCAIQAVFWRIHTRQFCQQLLFPTQALINFGPWLCLMCTVGDTATSRSGTGSRPTCQMCFQSSLIDYIQGQPRWHARMLQLIALRCTSGGLFTYWLISKVSTVQAVEAHWLYQTWVWGCVHW